MIKTLKYALLTTTLIPILSMGAVSPAISPAGAFGIGIFGGGAINTAKEVRDKSDYFRDDFDKYIELLRNAAQDAPIDDDTWDNKLAKALEGYDFVLEVVKKRLKQARSRTASEMTEILHDILFVINEFHDLNFFNRQLLFNDINKAKFDEFLEQLSTGMTEDFTTNSNNLFKNVNIQGLDLTGIIQNTDGRFIGTTMTPQQVNKLQSKAKAVRQKIINLNKKSKITGLFVENKISKDATIKEFKEWAEGLLDGKLQKNIDAINHCFNNKIVVFDKNKKILYINTNFFDESDLNQTLNLIYDDYHLLGIKEVKLSETVLQHKHLQDIKNILNLKEVNEAVKKRADNSEFLKIIKNYVTPLKEYVKNNPKIPAKDIPKETYAYARSFKAGLRLQYMYPYENFIAGGEVNGGYLFGEKVRYQKLDSTLDTSVTTSWFLNLIGKLGYMMSDQVCAGLNLGWSGYFRGYEKVNTSGSKYSDFKQICHHGPSFGLFFIYYLRDFKGVSINFDVLYTFLIENDLRKETSIKSNLRNKNTGSVLSLTAGVTFHPLALMEQFK